MLNPFENVKNHHLLISKDPFPLRPAKIEAMKNKIEVTAETRTHHSITPIDKSSLLYNIHTPDPPHVDPCHSSQAPSITLPISTGPGIEPSRQKNQLIIPFIIKTPKVETVETENSVDPVEVAHNEPPHLDL